MWNKESVGLVCHIGNKWQFRCDNSEYNINWLYKKTWFSYDNKPPRSNSYYNNIGVYAPENLKGKGREVNLPYSSDWILVVQSVEKGKEKKGSNLLALYHSKPLKVGKI